MTLTVMMPASVAALGWPITAAAFIFTPILLLLFQPQRVQLTWKRTVGCLAAIGLVMTVAWIGVICAPCQGCDPFWLQLLGICIK